MKKLKSIDVRSVFRMSLVLGVVAGLLVGVVFLIVDMISGRFMEGVFTFILAPLLYGIVGALVNAFMAIVYNKAAERLGGIEINLE